jgi:hypothetical protein
MEFDLDRAREFVGSAALPDRPSGVAAQDTAAMIFETTKQQAVVVGADVIAFVAGIQADVREAISDSALLAQLVANRKNPNKENVLGWFEDYFEVLETIGWTVQDKGFVKISESGDGFEVHENILEFAAAALAPVPGALAIVTATLNALKGVGSNAGWITIFNRESQQSKAGRFQISVAQPDANGGVLVTMMAFAIEAKTTVTQVLFFKLKNTDAILKKNDGKASINMDALRDLRDPIRKKVRDYQRSFVAGLLP